MAVPFSSEPWFAFSCEPVPGCMRARMAGRMPMKRVLRHVLAGLGLLAGGGALSMACAHNDSTIFVRDVLAPQLVTAGTACLFTPDPTQTFISSGTFDTSLRGDYEAAFLVGNQMVPQGDPTAPKTETSFVTITGAIVRVTDSQGHQISSSTGRTAATISPSTGGTPSYEPVFVTLIDPATAAKVAGSSLAPGDARHVVTYVRFLGQTLGGQSVESDEFAFPVDVCSGCLISYAGAAACTGGAGGSSMQKPVPCNLEDFAVDCCALGPSACNFVPSAPVVDAGAG
jgi:hypothetical protein